MMEAQAMRLMGVEAQVFNLRGHRATFEKAYPALDIPVIAGVWPLVSFRNAEFLANEVPGVEVPDSILDRMSTARTKEDGCRLGIEIAREIREAISDRVAGFQVSAPFGKVDLSLQVLAD